MDVNRAFINLIHNSRFDTQLSRITENVSAKPQITFENKALAIPQKRSILFVCEHFTGSPQRSYRMSDEVFIFLLSPSA